MKPATLCLLAAVACAKPPPPIRLRPEVDNALQQAELSRFPNPEARALLTAEAANLCSDCLRLSREILDSRTA